MANRYGVLIGACRDQTVFLDSLLCSRGIVAVGEVCRVAEQVGVNNDLCRCGTQAHDCPFWSAVLEVAFGASFRDDCARGTRLARSLQRPRTLALLNAGLTVPGFESYLEMTQAIVSSIVKIADRELVWDSSRSALHAYALVELGFAPTLYRLSGSLSDMSCAEPQQAASYVPLDEPRYTERRCSFNAALDWTCGVLVTRLIGRETGALRREDLIERPLQVADRIIQSHTSEWTTSTPWAHGIDPVR